MTHPIQWDVRQVSSGNELPVLLVIREFTSPWLVTGSGMNLWHPEWGETHTLGAPYRSCLCGIAHTWCKTSPLLRFSDQVLMVVLSIVRCSNKGRVVFHLVLKAKTQSCHSPLPNVSYFLPQAHFLPCALSQFTVFTCTHHYVSPSEMNFQIRFFLRLWKRKDCDAHPGDTHANLSRLLANLSWLIRKLAGD